MGKRMEGSAFSTLMSFSLKGSDADTLTHGSQKQGGRKAVCFDDGDLPLTVIECTLTPSLKLQLLKDGTLAHKKYWTISS